MHPDFTTPSDIAAESAVIGSMILEDAIRVQVLDILDIEDFYEPKHRIIFSAIRSISARSEPVDMVTMQSELESSQTLEESGGIGYISEIIDGTPTSVRGVHYAHMVRRCAIQRRVARAARVVIDMAHRPIESVDDLVASSQRLIAEASGGEAAAGYRSLADIALERWKGVLDGSAAPDTGIPTGFCALDSIMGGMRPGQVIVIAGRPAMGKTALALTIAAQVCSRRINGRRPTALIASLEMTQDEIWYRLASMSSGIPSEALRRRDFGESEYDALITSQRWCASVSIMIDETPCLSVAKLRLRARAVKAEHGLDLIVVDYLQLMRPAAAGKNANREQQVAGMSRDLKTVAREFAVPILVLSQLNRAVESRENKRPTMSDLRESGAIEQDADAILFIYRDEVYNKNTETPGEAEVIISKNRNGKTGIARLVFEGEITRFRERG